ncbi:FHA domain-containing protein [Streptomyces sp. WMMC500]|uniref:FHA domain-containing protein n=1 Tax=Streptomyces sp. WMMC500 TaxID=3015154 RepID=UPI00248AB673|nr:FHA domain-containing protein [Streptomyces sp. WMMC500]WBB64624.1 FHA domain-containing protein [Streptomyces sp. WMMC500]
MQIRLTVQATRGGGAARGRDVIVTAPAGTTLGAVAGGLLDAAAAAGGGGGAAGGAGGGAGVPVYAGRRLLDPDRTLLGEPPLVDGAVLSLGGPADPDHGRPPEADAAAVTSLRVVAGPDAGGVHLLHGGQIRIGRSADADVPLDDPDVSRLHCALTVAPDGGVTVADLGSTNGTTVDGVPVGTAPVPLRTDAVLRVGETALRITEPAAGAREAAVHGGAGSGRADGGGAGHGGGPGPGAAQDPAWGSASAEHSRVPEQRRPQEPGTTTSGLGGGWPAGGGPEYGGPEYGGAEPGRAHEGDGESAAYGGERGSGHPDQPGAGRRGPGAGAGYGPVGADRTHGVGTHVFAEGSGAARGDGDDARAAHGSAATEPGDGEGHGAPGRGGPGGAAPRRSGTPTRGTVVPPELRPRGAAAGTASVPQPPRRGIRAWARRLGGREDAAALAAAPSAARPGAARAGTAELHERYPDAAAVLLAALAGEAAYRPGFVSAPDDAPGNTPDDAPAHHPAHPGDTAGTARAGGRGLVFRRGSEHADALVVRLGTEFRAGGGTAPLTVGLRRAGSLALAGPRARLAGLARSVVAQLAALHGPDVLELVLVSADPARPHESRVEDWSWAGWLPHVRPRQGQDCRLLLAYDREQAAARVGELQRRLEQPVPGLRSVVVVDGDPGTAAVRDAVARLAEHGPAAGVHVVCLAETPPATPASPLTATYAAAREAAPGFAACGAVGLLSGDVATGLRLLQRPAEPGAPGTVAPSARAEPSAEYPYAGRAAADDSAHDSAGDPARDPAAASSPATAYGTGRARLRGDGFAPSAEPGAAGGWFEVAASGQGAAGPAGTVDAVSAAWAERLARALAPYGEREETDDAHPARRGALPGAVRLLDELGLARATPTALTARWLESRSGAPRVAAVLGAGPGGRLLTDLAAGPLAVEGAARGGKSELLRSFAAALAAGEPPERLQLVLVDGAGRERGDALGAAADLPHVSGYLVASDPVRMREFAQELGAEFKRRAARYAPEGEPAPQGPAIPGPRAAGDPRPGGAADVHAPQSNTLRLRPRSAAEDAPGTGPGAGTASGTGAPAGAASGTGTGGGQGASPGARGGAEPESRATAGRRAVPPAVVLLVDDYDALVAPALGSPARPAAGSVVRVVEAIARDGGPLGMHLVTATARSEATAATAAVSGAAHHVVLGGDDVPPGRGLLCAAGAEPVPFQAARVTGRIPRTATARPTVVPLEWARMGSPPTSRPLRELGNGPTDLALLASALQRAAGAPAAQPDDTRTPSP